MLLACYQEESCQGQLTARGELRDPHPGRERCLPAQIPQQVLGASQFSRLMKILISSTVFLSSNLNFYQLYLFKILIRPLPLRYLRISSSSLYLLRKRCSGPRWAVACAIAKPRPGAHRWQGCSRVFHLVWLCHAYTSVLGNCLTLSVRTTGCPAGKAKESFQNLRSLC